MKFQNEVSKSIKFMKHSLKRGILTNTKHYPTHFCRHDAQAERLRRREEQQRDGCAEEIELQEEMAQLRKEGAQRLRDLREDNEVGRAPNPIATHGTVMSASAPYFPNQFLSSLLTHMVTSRLEKRFVDSRHFLNSENNVAPEMKRIRNCLPNESIQN